MWRNVSAVVSNELTEQISADMAFKDLYPELRRLDHQERYRFGWPASLQTTSPIHEVLIKLSDRPGWNNRSLLHENNEPWR
jgi:hypothetical protein